VLVLSRQSDLSQIGFAADQLLVQNYELSVQAALAFRGITKPKSKSKQSNAGSHVLVQNQPQTDHERDL
jgi:hypothetical protein